MMRNIFLLMPIILCSLLINAQESNTTTYFLIRHAEKVSENPADKNPDLNERGFQRAENWEKVLKHISFDAIYATNYKRTLNTVAPIARKMNLITLIYNPSKVDFYHFQLECAGKNVLIVGHSNTIPQFVNELIHQQKYQEMNDDEFSYLYIVTVKGNQITDLLLCCDF